MKQLVSISFVLASLAGVAAAQQPAPPAKGSAAPPAAPAGKAAPAAPAGKAAPAAPATPAAPGAPAATTPPKPPEVPAELVDAGKKWAGAWKCTGTSTVMEQTVNVKATVTHKVDANLNKFWIQTSFNGTAPKMPPMKGTWFTTYDAANKKLWRVTMNARGGHGTAWGTWTDNKISWEGDARWGGVDVKTRTTEEMVSPKELKVMGESSKDGGKTWAKDVEATCKK
jgi:hypothetical protein